MSEKKRKKERYEILFEEVNSKMDLVLEGYKEIGNKFEEARREREEIRNDLTQKIEFVSSGLHKKIENTEQRLDRKIEDTRECLTTKIIDAEQRLAGRMDRIGAKQDDHEMRIEVLEKKVSV
jgi:hypothetical protein